ncbi:MAG: hypothetical protein HFJ81_07060 [Clostridia bacterium]|nr:hypothetical protein [Clostridia bacterium]
MKKSPFKITIFIISIVTLILSFVLCIYFNAFSIFTQIPFWNSVKEFFENGYVINVITSIAVIILMYFIQLTYCKRKIKQDYRCNEVIEDIQDGLDKSNALISAADIFLGTKLNDQTTEEQHNHYQFYNDNKAKFDVINPIFTYENNDILISSIQSVFFINLNFKLLNIINNIKNRLPTISAKYKDIEKLFVESDKNNTETICKLDNQIKHYLIDLRFMTQYWQKLLDYLKYDPIETKTYIAFFKNEYDTEEKLIHYLNQPIKEKTKNYKHIMRVARRQIRKQRWSNFFNKE